MTISVDERLYKLAGAPGWFVRGEEVAAAQQMSVADLTTIVEDSVKNFPENTPVHILDDASTLHLVETLMPVVNVATHVDANGKVYGIH